MKMILTIFLLTSSNSYAANQWLFKGATHVSTEFNYTISVYGEDQYAESRYAKEVRDLESRICQSKYDSFRASSNEIKIAYRLTENRLENPRPGYIEGFVTCEIMTVIK